MSMRRDGIGAARVVLAIQRWHRPPVMVTGFGAPAIALTPSRWHCRFRFDVGHGVRRT
jgi:hypothetical protein